MRHKTRKPTIIGETFPLGYFFTIYTVGRKSACGPFYTIKEARESAMNMPDAEFIYKVEDSDTVPTLRKYKMSKAWEKLHKVSQK
jgi:hypothetical protein